jgi:tRNA dimethylallyltransferase
MLLIITGPTASGKTYIAEKIAGIVQGEIISADSRTIYRELDIGTGKFTNSDQIPYHLTNVAGIGQNISSYDWVQKATRIIRKIEERDRIPIICGGTMHYIHAFINGIDSVPGPDEEMRRDLREMAKKEGKVHVHDLLKKMDPILANSVHPNNLDRVIRYIEKVRGIIKVDALSPFEGPFAIFFIEPNKELLRSRVSSRVKEMIAQGWIEEVESLIEQGYEIDEPGFDSIGYREIFKHIKGDITLQEAERSICRRTMEYSKKQLNWKKRLDPHTIHINDPSDLESAVDIMKEILHRSCRSRQYAA